MRLMIKRLASYLPSPLPVGMSEFNKWSDDIISLSGKFADVDSMKFALASQIMHLGAQQAYVPKNYFVKSMRKAAANQVASQAFQDIKNKQQEATKAAELVAQQSVEVTTPPGVVDAPKT